MLAVRGSINFLSLVLKKETYSQTATDTQRMVVAVSRRVRKLVEEPVVVRTIAGSKAELAEAPPLCSRQGADSSENAGSRVFTYFYRKNQSQIVIHGTRYRNLCLLLWFGCLYRQSDLGS